MGVTGSDVGAAEQLPQVLNSPNDQPIVEALTLE